MYIENFWGGRGSSKYYHGYIEGGGGYKGPKNVLRSMWLIPRFYWKYFIYKFCWNFCISLSFDFLFQCPVFQNDFSTGLNFCLIMHSWINQLKQWHIESNYHEIGVLWASPLTIHRNVILLPAEARMEGLPSMDNEGTEKLCCELCLPLL